MYRPGCPPSVKAPVARTSTPANRVISDSSSPVGGLGGCPFAPAAPGNIATEDLIYMLNRGGIETGVDLAALMDTCSWMNDVVGRQLPAMVSRAGGFP